MKLGERIKERRFQLGAVAVILAVLIVIALAFKITGSMAFCVKFCHSTMVDQYNEVQASKHRGIACIECHLKPGLIGNVQTKVGALPELIIQLGGIEAEEIEAKERTPNELCIYCHDYPPVVYLSAVNRINLKEKIEKGEAYCDDCHMRKDHVIKSNPIEELKK